ncbi:MAG: hypothetical protein ACYCPS_03985 [Candidatus Saccharimonadales bacterium]
MLSPRFKEKRKQWLIRYIPAELLGTVIALIGAWAVYGQTRSYIAATAAGWFGEGIGFYGYMITSELKQNVQKYTKHRLLKRLFLVATSSSTNLMVEFMPAEIVDNLFIRPFLMYLMPHYIHPYPLGFLVGKFAADILFYFLAIIGYETRKRWLKN